MALGLAALRSPEPGPEIARRLQADTTEMPLVLFVFQEGDCSTYSRMVRRLDEWARTDSVRPVALGIDVPEERRAVLNAGALSELTFEVRFDLSEEAKRLLAITGFRRTPTSMILDPEGRLRSAHPPVATPALQERVAGALARDARLVLGGAPGTPTKPSADGGR